jgi:putative nucleotidyltransferase with HDIG domain
MKKKPTQHDFAVGLILRLREAGHTAYFAGGCVRDALLGKEPKDYDVATSARPEQVEALFPRSRGVGAHFGVILVREGGHDYEIATFRSDGPYRDGRRPEGVTFSGEAEDAQRRDFTINGMFLDPIEEKVVDYVDGQIDLKNKIVRAIGDPIARFREDHLRMLRAVRFATALDFEIESATFAAILQHADDIRKISAERVREEVSRIFVGPGRVRGFDLLVETGLMACIFPEILVLQGCEQPPQFHPEGDVFVHTRLMLSLLPEKVSLPLVLSVLFHDIGKPATYSYDETNARIRFNGHDKVGAEMAEGILKRLRYPGKVISECVEMINNHMVFKDVQKMRTSKLKRFMARETFEDEMELHRVDCLGSWGGLDNHIFLREKQAEFAAEPLIPPRLVTGADLIERGLKPGPPFSHVLTEIQNLQLEGSLTTRAGALEWLDDFLKAQGTSASASGS